MSLQLNPHALTIQIFDKPDKADPLNQSFVVNVFNYGKQLQTVIDWDIGKDITGNLQACLEAALPLCVQLSASEPQPRISTQ
jgi:hypothetical protein